MIHKTKLRNFLAYFNFHTNFYCSFLFFIDWYLKGLAYNAWLQIGNIEKFILKNQVYFKIVSNSLLSPPLGMWTDTHTQVFHCRIFPEAPSHLGYLTFPIALDLKKTFIWIEERHSKFSNNHKTPWKPWINECTHAEGDFIFFRLVKFIPAQRLVIASMCIFQTIGLDWENITAL